MKDKIFISNGNVTVVALSFKIVLKYVLPTSQKPNFYLSFYSPNLDL